MDGFALKEVEKIKKLYWRWNVVNKWLSLTELYNNLSDLRA